MTCYVYIISIALQINEKNTGDEIDWPVFILAETQLKHNYDIITIIIQWV